ncbi:precorrin-6A synthase (deacetylating) [Paracoccus laeviglucosivorans]|uniref:Precorrin-6A synthase [deacetylating] n=1 Tax=Paracoccus laeviglucosivorans TaxID=1197861 RepID=A0A521DVG2_9RHOB|nr:precorrin-6A synthase (deacetylating) [Paracoccus laeviglucosivorans]SMO75677.1 precorrin-6A synthase (deacetylating) [Paracoccus laeviglucosivorans]
MIDLTLIGIGSGSPGHLTREGAAAMAVADLILIPEKAAKSDLADLRRALVAEVLVTPPPMTSFPMPERRVENGYRQGVEEWHDAIAAQWEAVIRAHGAARPALLVWGDPSLYDSSLRIAARVARRLPLHLRVIPGITAVQALCAAHAIPLNDVAQPVTITTGRQLSDNGWPFGDRVVVMLDGDCAFQTLDPQGIDIWWGAFLGLPQQMLMHGPLAEIGPKIIEARARARAAHGWIMDTYLLARCALP